MDIFAEHGVPGIIGLFFNGFLAADYIIGLDGVNTGLAGGGLNGVWEQVYKQLAFIVACMAYSFVVSVILAFVINKIPGLRLRVSEQAELLGTDDDQMGEFAYDYVEVRRDYLAWTPAKGHQTQSDHVASTDQFGVKQHSEMLDGRDPNENGLSNGHHGSGIEKSDREMARNA